MNPATSRVSKSFEVKLPFWLRHPEVGISIAALILLAITFWAVDWRLSQSQNSTLRSATAKVSVASAYFNDQLSGLADGLDRLCESLTFADPSNAFQFEKIWQSESKRLSRQGLILIGLDDTGLSQKSVSGTANYKMPADVVPLAGETRILHSDAELTGFSLVYRMDRPTQGITFVMINIPLKTWQSWFFRAFQSQDGRLHLDDGYAQFDLDYSGNVHASQLTESISRPITSIDNHSFQSRNSRAFWTHTSDRSQVWKGLRVTAAVSEVSATHDYAEFKRSAYTVAIAAYSFVALFMVLVWFVLKHLAHQEKKMYSLAMLDSLTHLPNRRAFNSTLNLEVLRCNRSGASGGILFIDLDEFKTVNDTLGHDAGDALLKQVAIRLRAAVRDCDLVFRLGGDEFTILLVDLDESINTHAIAQRVIDSLAEPLLIKNQPLTIHASIGLALIPTDGQTAEEILQCADIAVYAAKARGKNQWARYTPDMRH